MGVAPRPEEPWDGGGSDDDELPLAPPEEPQAGAERDEPTLAPDEDAEEAAAVLGVAERALRLVAEAYEGSCDAGNESTLAAVRGLHPHWDEVDADSRTGKLVRWVRVTNDWVYGELSTSAFVELMRRVPPEQRGVFVDLGSGAGRAAALASLAFRRSVGLELQEDMHALAEGRARSFRAAAAECGVQHGELLLANADFLGQLTPVWRDPNRLAWWDAADVAFACAAKYAPATLRGLAERAAAMRSGSLFATVRHALPSDCFGEVCRFTVDCSWGRDELILCRRL